MLKAQQCMRETRLAALALLDPLYQCLRHSTVSPLLDSAPMRRLRFWVVPGMTASDVLGVIDTLGSHGISCWLVGGWGVDALVRRQTRKHWDVDIAIDVAERDRAVSVLEKDGFTVLLEETLPAWMPKIIILRDSRRRRVELMPVDVPAPAACDETRPTAMQFRYTDDSFAEGMLAGRVIRCLSAPVQLLFHTGYPARNVDRRDVQVLTSYIGQLPQKGGS
jgi:lincosamide nucleotidyltransferase A/C/D/E